MVIKQRLIAFENRSRANSSASNKAKLEFHNHGALEKSELLR